MLITALPFYVLHLTGSALAAGGMFIANTVPSVLFGSVAGVFADRWNRQWTMVAADLSRATLLLSLLLVRSPRWAWAVYAIVFVSSCLSLFFSPAKSALLPRLAGEEHLVAANALNGMNYEAGRLLGPSLGGVLLAVLGLPGVVLADSASFVISGLLIARISGVAALPPAAPDDTPAATTSWTRTWREWWEGLRLVRRSRMLASFFLIAGIAGVAEGIFQVIFVVFVSRVLHGGPRELGWLMTATGVGGVAGGLVVARLGQRVRPGYLVALLAIDGVIVVALTLSPLFPVALVLFALAGLPVAGYVVGFTTVLQNNAPDNYRGRIFGAFATTWALAVLVGQGISGALGDHGGSIPLLRANGALDIAADILALALLRSAAAVAEMADTVRRGG